MEKLVLLKDLHSVKGTFKTTTANVRPNTQSQKFRSTNNRYMYLDCLLWTIGKVYLYFL